MRSMFSDQVPQEVLCLIASFADRDTLKALRLTSAAFKDAATRLLFAEIHVSLSSHSFDRARYFVSCEYLTKYTRSLVYHLGVLEEVYSGFDRFQSEFLTRSSTTSTHSPSDITPEVLWAYNCYLEETDGYRTFELIDEEEELQALCEALPELDSVSILLDEVDYFGPPQDYVSKRTGLAPIHHDYKSHLPGLLLALGPRDLRRLSARNMDWDDFVNLDDDSTGGMEAHRHLLQTLESLEIGMYITALPNSQDQHDQHRIYAKRHGVDAFGRILSSSTRLHTLKLDFEELPFESRVEDMLPVSRIIFRHYWPNLRDLKLEVICTCVTEFMAFLAAHRSTLRRLQLGDIDLTREEGGYPSVLLLFWEIRQVLRLDECRITGNFTNRFNEAWYVDTEYRSDSCLRDQLERYMCGVALSDRPELQACHDFIDSCVKAGLCAPPLDPSSTMTSDIFCDQSWQSYPELIDANPAEHYPLTEGVSQSDDELD